MSSRLSRLQPCIVSPFKVCSIRDTEGPAYTNNRSITLYSSQLILISVMNATIPNVESVTVSDFLPYLLVVSAR